MKTPDDENEQRETKHLQWNKRKRQFWMWMAFLPGILSPVVVYLWIFLIRGGQGSGALTG